MWDCIKIIGLNNSGYAFYGKQIFIFNVSKLVAFLLCSHSQMHLSEPTFLV